MSKNIFKIYIYYFYIFYIDCYILIPLNIYNNNYIEKILSSEIINENDLSFVLYNKISLGEPKQDIIFTISPEEYNFYMVTNRNSIITNDSFYDYRISKTKNINIDEKNMDLNAVFISEKFYLENKSINQNYIQEIGVDNINLVLYFQKPNFLRNYDLSSNVNSYIIFGLKLPE